MMNNEYLDEKTYRSADEKRSLLSDEGLLVGQSSTIDSKTNYFAVSAIQELTASEVNTLTQHAFLLGLHLGLSKSGKIWTFPGKQNTWESIPNPLVKQARAATFCGDEDKTVNGLQLQSYKAGPDWPGGTFRPPTRKECTGETIIPNYQTLSIIVAVVLLSPIAAIALSFAMKANAFKRAREYKKAFRAAKRSLYLNLLAIAVGILCYSTLAVFVWYNIHHAERNRVVNK
ncbi:hypothetical protein Bpfe_022679 [Biomphalaria pfeifferi]|uniref:Uncharacterized protein n=1 Tax=Biomphalaria pfeifferi TaxID=112525 RepID=A0AAD8B714_BIOPF|nr:hypothetical protein Bpfe_022679 [Biomphalaria pfeifferi]